MTLCRALRSQDRFSVSRHRSHEDDSKDAQLLARNFVDITDLASGRALALQAPIAGLEESMAIICGQGLGFHAA